MSWGDADSGPARDRLRPGSVDAVNETPAIRLSGLRKSFGSLTAVDGVDLSIRPGEVVALLGPNGAGKSTTIDLALGLARPQTLKVSVLGRAGIAPDLGVYGRVGTTVGRPVASLVPTADAGGMSYGVGFKWDFSPRGSALLGWDSYDLRTGLGDARDVRAASLGLQWRY